MIIVRIYEGLGNQLFQYAYARSLSLSTKQQVFLDIRKTGSKKEELRLTSREYRLHHFKISLPICNNVHHFYPYLCETDYMLEIIQTLSEKKILPYKFYKEDTPEYKEKLLKIKGNWYLQGWFQDSRYFNKYANIIRKEIVPKNKITISSDLKHILKTKNTVAVHIRRGDYKRSSSVLPITYYRNAIKHIENMIVNPFWIVFSDEIEWAKNNIIFEKNCFYMGLEEKLEDYEELMIMSCCRNYIISNSTFSWWGAWLGKYDEKIVIGPERWGLDRICDYGQNIMPENWLKESLV